MGIQYNEIFDLYKTGSIEISPLNQTETITVFSEVNIYKYQLKGRPVVSVLKIMLSKKVMFYKEHKTIAFLCKKGILS